MTLAEILDQFLTPILVIVGFTIQGLRRKDDRLDAVVAGVARLETSAIATAEEIKRHGDARHALAVRVTEHHAESAREIRGLSERVAVLEDRVRRP